jgi:acyl-CoA synthetase (AMP-forming)/AMP-acid ligase II
MTILDRLEGMVAEAPDQVFCRFVKSGIETPITWKQLWKRSQLYARAYEARGLRRGSVVIIMLQHSDHLYYSFIGAMMYGAIPSFMPYPTPKQELGLFWDQHRILFERIEVGGVVTYAEIVEQIGDIGAAELMLSDHVDISEAASFNRIHARSTDTALLQHSSGTTGVKKGVMLTHGAILAQADSYGPTIALDRSATIASWLPLYHDMGLIACFVLPLVIGVPIVHLDPFEWVGAPLTLLDKVQEHRATHVWIPNFAFNHLAMNRRGEKMWDLSSLVAVNNCSEPCKVESMERFSAAFADCGLSPTSAQVCYAMAETVFAASQTPLTRPLKSYALSRSRLADQIVAPPTNDSDQQLVASCGLTIPGMAVRVADNGGGTLADGMIGEICLTGPSLYAGYHRLPDVTAQKFRDGWHHTGDLGFVHAGEIYVTGRKDDLLIVRGRNYYAHDVEASMNGTNGIHPGRVVCFATHNEMIGTSEVICLAELRPDAEAAVVRRELRANVERDVGVVVGKVVFVPSGSLIKTTSGKISRKDNAARYVAGVFAGT